MTDFLPKTKMETPLLTVLLQQVILVNWNGEMGEIGENGVQIGGNGCIFPLSNRQDGLEKDHFQGYTLKMTTNISQNLDYFLDGNLFTQD